MWNQLSAGTVTCRCATVTVNTTVFVVVMLPVNDSLTGNRWKRVTSLLPVAFNGTCIVALLPAGTVTVARATTTVTVLVFGFPPGFLPLAAVTARIVVPRFRSRVVPTTFTEHC